VVTITVNIFFELKLSGAYVAG